MGHVCLLIASKYIHCTGRKSGEKKNNSIKQFINYRWISRALEPKKYIDEMRRGRVGGEGNFVFVVVILQLLCFKRQVHI